MKFDHDFKEAIINLSEPRKDKLLLRLLKKNVNLANQLFFELVCTKSVDERRSDMEMRIRSEVDRFSENFWSPGYLMMDMRYLSGEITDHVRTTKDKFGEVSLNLLMLKEVLRVNKKAIENSPPAKMKKLEIYIIARTFKILLLIQKLHQDYLLDLEGDVKALGLLIGSNDTLMRTTIYHGLDINWLVNFTIPNDINEIHKQLKANGYLK